MSPARTLSIEDLAMPEIALGGLWSAKGPKRQKKQQKKREEDDEDLADDLKMLWETRWKSACKRQSHPFQDASYLEVATLITSLIQRGVTSAHSPDYTDAFLTLAESLARDARASLLSPGNAEHASGLLLRACALLRIARFPYSPSSSSPSPPQGDDATDNPKARAHALQKSYYVEAAGLSGLNSPLDEVLIPHVHDPATHPDTGLRGDLGRHHGAGTGGAAAARHRPQIPAFVRVPLETLLTGRPCPAAVVLAADRTGSTGTCEDVLARGWACVVVEVPGGAGDCPVGRRAGAEAEAQLWRSVLDWMGGMFFFDMERVVVLGEEGAAAARLAGALGGRVRGVVAYADDDADGLADGEGLFGREAPPLCRALVISGGSEAVAAPSGLWTPPLEDEAAPLTLAAYEPGSAVCVGRLETADAGQVYGWMEAVVDAGAGEVEGAPRLAFEPARPAGKAVPRWFAADFTPPASDVELASSLGSSLY